MIPLPLADEFILVVILVAAPFFHPFRPIDLQRGRFSKRRMRTQIFVNGMRKEILGPLMMMMIVRKPATTQL
jgi:hypothetical protein